MKLKCWFLSLLSVSLACNNEPNENEDPAIDPLNIFRPCPDLDINCIRNYFFVNSECEIAEGPVPHPLLLKHYKLNIPSSNITAEMYNTRVEGLNGDIKEFYVNTETGKLLLSVEVHDLRLYTDESLVIYYSKCHEPVERCGYVDYKYDTMTFTVVFPCRYNLNLRQADIYTSIDDVAPDFRLGSSISADLDPESEEQYKSYLFNTPTSLQEIFVTQGRVFFGSYIQYNICDFGLELDSDE